MIKPTSKNDEDPVKRETQAERDQNKRPWKDHPNSLLSKLFKGELGPDAVAKFHAWQKKNAEQAKQMERWYSEIMGQDYHDEM